jgi:signal transduction histidine kinase
MGTRTKVFLLFTIFGVIPVVALSAVNYLNGVRAVKERLRGEVEGQARAAAQAFGRELKNREDAILALARAPGLRSYVRTAGKASPARASDPLKPSNLSAESAAPPPLDEILPKDAQVELRAFLLSGQKYYLSVTCLGTSKQQLFQAELDKGRDGSPLSLYPGESGASRNDIDKSVWSVPAQTPLVPKVARYSFGSILLYAVPLFIEGGTASTERGALVVELKLDPLLDDAADDVGGVGAAPAPAPAPGNSSSPRLIMMVDRVGTALYHSNDALKYQPVVGAMPLSFKPVVDAMTAGQSGSQFYVAPDGHDWIAGYQPLAPLDLSVVVASDYSTAVRDLRWWGWLSIALCAFIGLSAAVLLFLYLRRTARSIERVTEGAVAIAKGRLDERIEVRSSDETRVLAETFNAMGDRLREQIAREAESRQFESFMRLSAMLTHDLKNSIQALSLIVGNMEQQFHREEFRMDAMRSLRDATSQLSGLVARLSEPVRSLSGEFKRPRPVDLVPVIRRALSRTARPASEMHELEIDLPAQLVAVADEERIEKVVENLVLNALEAMGAKRGRLIVKAGPAEEGFVFFSVSDTGPGMTEEFQRTRLFRPFATTKPKGVGLGLYTCRELVRALGGRVEVESKRGSGTCFRVVLPSDAITESGQKSGRTE